MILFVFHLPLFPGLIPVGNASGAVLIHYSIADVDKVKLVCELDGILLRRCKKPAHFLSTLSSARCLPPHIVFVAPKRAELDKVGRTKWGGQSAEDNVGTTKGGG